MAQWEQQPPSGGQFQGGFAAPPPPAQASAKLDVGELLGTTARLVGGNFGVFFAVAFAATLPGLALQQFFMNRMQQRMIGMQQDILTNPGQLPDWSWLPSFADVGGTCLGTLVSFALVYVAQAVLVFDVVENLAGRKPPMAQALRVGIGRAPSVLAAALLLSLIHFGATLPGIAIGALVIVGGAAAGDTAGALGACCGAPLMLVLGLGPLFYVAVTFFVTVPAAVVEDVGPVAALARSLELTRGHRGRIALTFLAVGAVFLVLFCMGGACTGAVGSVGASPGAGVFAVQEPSTFALAVSFLVQLGLQSIQTMTIAALAAVVYARLRGIRDGVDAEALAQVFA